MKKVIFLTMLALFSLSMMAQNNDEGKDSLLSNTKYGELFFQKGIFFKYEDFAVEKYIYTKTTNYSKIKTSIRKIYGISKNRYFVKLRIGDSKVYIEYPDLVEINKSLGKLKSEAEADCLKKPVYLHNSFITDDNFEIGYWVEKKYGKYSANWFFDFNRHFVYGALFDSDIDIDKVSQMLQEKQAQIEKMIAND